MKACIYSLALCFIACVAASQNVVIAESESDADPSAILDIQSFTKGLLVPRVSLSQRVDILNPAEGLLVYQLDDVKGFYYFQEGQWTAFVNTTQITNFGSGSVITNEERKNLERLDTLDLVPIGSIIPFAGPQSNIPEGWLLCDGTPRAVGVYHKLFEAIGYSWGGSADIFYLPDLRGYFLRGKTGSTGNDPDATSRTNIDGTEVLGNVVGSYQSDEVGPHSHIYYDYQIKSGRVSASEIGAYNGSSAANDEETTLVNSGSESRPKNAYVNYIIKY